jgi:DNA-binding CsgD family transcriptional regulator
MLKSRRQSKSNLGTDTFDLEMLEAAWACHRQIGAGDAKGYVPVEVAAFIAGACWAKLMLLQLVAPQFVLAHRNAQAFTELKQAAGRTIPTPENLRQIGLTAREGEVLHWMIQGKRDKEVAHILSASPRTIHNHVRSILRKLNTETRTAAALEALERLKGSSASWGL